ncbi:unnamed protein product [Acanthosepion pharaonis]|uniref:Uncharacterized protein n=1 Tax=Acanthosepion pharaonis TaxID=158019 RepID=A0A812DI92_ACAPH|nr:unnamed protein product [Sepia pharaonis]
MNLSALETKEAFFWSKQKLNQPSLYSGRNFKSQLNTYLCSIFPNRTPDIQKSKKKEYKSGAGFSCDNSYQISDSSLKKHLDASPEMEKAVECLKRTFFSNNSAQNKSSNAKSHLLLPNDKDNTRRDTLIDNFFAERTKKSEQLTFDESDNGDSESVKTALSESVFSLLFFTCSPIFYLYSCFFGGFFLSRTSHFLL